MVPLYFLTQWIVYLFSKKTCIVFDQGALNVWGRRNRLSSSNLLLAKETYIPSESNSETFDSSCDWEPVTDIDWDISATPFGELEPMLSPSQTSLKESRFPNYTPDRSRKCSISDIIDVLNLDKEKGSYESHSSSDKSLLSHNDNIESSSRFNSDTDVSIQEEVVESEIVAEDIFDQSIDVNRNNISNKESFSGRKDVYCNVSKSAKIQLEKFNEILRGNFKAKEKKLNSNELSVNNNTKSYTIILVDEKNDVKYVSGKESVKFDKESFTGKNKKRTKINCLSVNAKTVQQEQKRICLDAECKKPNKGKRERNNAACRKFRRARKEQILTLFEKESILLQKNLNLKEQINALNRQLACIKEKLNVKSD